MFDEDVAFSAPLPSLLLGEPVRQQQLRVLRTGLVGVSGPSAYGASPVSTMATAFSLFRVDVVGLDPYTAFWPVTVHTLPSRNVPFERTLPESHLEIFWDMSQDCAERDLVEAALWRPLLLILHGGRYEPGETLSAVAVTRNFDDVAGAEIIQAGDAFTSAFF